MTLVSIDAKISDAAPMLKILNDNHHCAGYPKSLFFRDIVDCTYAHDLISFTNVKVFLKLNP